MLARNLRARAGRDAVRPASQLHSIADVPLRLPFLCPAQLRWSTRMAPVHSSPSTVSRLPAQRAPYALAARRDSTRSLATTTDISSVASTHMPFEGIARAFASQKPDPHLAQVPSWSTSAPLVVQGMISSATTPSTPRKYGIGGDPTELHQNLYACLRVGRMERAEAILKRLVDLYDPSAPELVDAHDIFLQTKVDLADRGTEDFAKEIEHWYNINMVRRGIAPTGQTLVTLLRAVMTIEEPWLRKEKMRHYLAIAHGHGPQMVEDINSSPDFSDEEWDALIKFQDDVFNEPPPMAAEEQAEFSTDGGMALAIEHGLISDPSLAIDPVELQGHGLSSLKASLAVFEPGQTMPYPDDLEGTKEEKDKAYAYMRQIRLERDGLEAATERWKAEDEKLREMGIHGVLQSKPMQGLMWNWYTATLPKVEEELKRINKVLANPCMENHMDDRHVYGPYLEGISAKKLAASAIATLVHCAAAQTDRDDEFETGQSTMIRIPTVASRLGQEVEKLANEDLKARHAAYMKKVRQKIRRELVAKLRKDECLVTPEGTNTHTVTAHSDNLAAREYPIEIRMKLGALLIDMVMQSAKITVTREDPRTGKNVTSTFPAFNHNTAYSNGKRTANLSPHPEVLAKLRTEHVGVIQPTKLPMLVEPKPWVGFHEGAYYTQREPVVRLRASDVAPRAYAVSAIENNDMHQVLAGLDALGRVPWKINRDVFMVMATAWNAGEGVGGFIPKEPELQHPGELAVDATTAERAKHYRALKLHDNLKQAYHSQKAFQNFQLEVARAYLNEPKFYYPHSIDFRGRAYPIPPLLNHMGSDLARGLLQFANGKELGNSGLQWLKVHLANLYGYDKASLRDRERFADDNVNEIYDSATNPLGGNRWWLKADDPWQCLACCIELKNALDSPDPTRYVSHLPIHQDGTCNGLQHYAALGGDRAGASQVNLEPSDKPQDIYTGVADLVREMVANEARKGNALAKFMDGKITRSVVKRTVMTNVYGVTFQGARMQVLDELEAMFPDHSKVTWDGPYLPAVATDIARKIFLALGKIFNGAQDIQCWLGECGERITSSLSAEQIQRIKAFHEGAEATFAAKYNQKKKISATQKKNLLKDAEVFKNGIIWTTPLKLPVVQPYKKSPVKRVHTCLTEMNIGGVSRSDEVDKRKQLQAFPPNFIHSLDATHMLLSALKCSELGIEFAAVHDSFWTHACDISNMNVVLRDAFVRMHSEDVIGRLLAEFEARYAGSFYEATLRPDSAAAQEIKAWRKEQETNPRAATSEEVALEAKRRELLASEDPELRKQGEEMVTPTSIWLKYADPSSLYSPRQSVLGETKTKREPDEMVERLHESEADRFQELAVEYGAQEQGQHQEQHQEVTHKASEEPKAVPEAEASVETASAEPIDLSGNSESQEPLDLSGNAETPEPASESHQSIDLSASSSSAKVSAETTPESPPVKRGRGRPRKTVDPTQVAEKKVAEKKVVEKKQTVRSRVQGTIAKVPSDGTTGRKYPVKVWLPLSFPPVPKKGDWDVTRLHQSKYFFS